MSLEQVLASIPSGHPDETLARQVNFDRLPAHVAVIMDGNGRWAAQRHLPRVEGHRAGIDAVRDTVETAARLGIQVLTLYAFSMENWKRPAAEVSTLAGTRVAAEGAGVWNPAFDVTPASLITAFITDAGVLRPPFEASIAAALATG